jgi:hypothetical protein
VAVLGACGSAAPWEEARHGATIHRGVTRHLREIFAIRGGIATIPEG